MNVINNKFKDLPIYEKVKYGLAFAFVGMLCFAGILLIIIGILK